jgi:molecular chaperone DnaK (HSP70)
VQIDGAEQTLSAHAVAVRFLAALFGTAKDFLSGVPIAGAVLAVPLAFSAAQSAALKEAAQDAGIIVLQLLPAPSAALVGYGLTAPGPRGALPTSPEGDESGALAEYAPGRILDRTIAVVDVGGGSTTATLVAARAGLYTLLASATAPVGGRAIDDALIAFFAKEFTKKTKISIGKEDKRAWAKLRNEAENTKKALSASAGAQQCSVESLAEGMDFSGSINRVRLDMLAAPTYDGVVSCLKEALASAGLEAAHVDEVILAGGTARLPGVSERLGFLFPEEGGASITASIDSSELLARGCAVEAQVIAALPADSAQRKHIDSLPAAPPAEASELKTRTTARPFGLVVPAEKSNRAAINGQLFVTLLAAHTPLPARRAFTLTAPAAGGKALLSFAEGTPDVGVEVLDAPEPDPEDEDDEPEAPEEIRTARVKADDKRVAEIALDTQKGASVLVSIEAAADGSLTIKAEVEGSDASELVQLPAPKA